MNSWILELNLRSLDLTLELMEDNCVRNHDVSIVFVVPGTKILENKVL
jgi:hypothetical protein